MRCRMPQMPSAETVDPNFKLSSNALRTYATRQYSPIPRRGGGLLITFADGYSLFSGALIGPLLRAQRRFDALGKCLDLL